MTTMPKKATGLRSSERESRWHGRLLRSRYLVGAVLLHLIVFLLVGTLVIWKASPPPVDWAFHGVSVKVPPPPPPPTPVASGASALNPQLEPDVATVPVVTPVTTITTDHSVFTVDASKALNQTMTHLASELPKGSGLSTGSGDASGLGNSAFGSSTSAGGGFSGYLYDLKQTSDRHPTSMAPNDAENSQPNVAPGGWEDFRGNKEEITFLKNFSVSFDENLLTDYYRAPTPLFASQIFVPMLQAAEAPKAFAVEKTVQPRRWIVVYKARIIPPITGDFRFLGFADDYMLVRIDDQNVLDACWNKGVIEPGVDANEDVGLAPGYTGGYGPNKPLAGGTWVHMTAGISMDMKVLIGEGPGGQSCFFLFIQQKDVAYRKGDYPVFQVGDAPLPGNRDPQLVPPAFSGKKMVFGLQPQ